MSESAFWMSTFEEHGSSVMAFLASRTGRRDIAEDLLQETFVRAIRARPEWPDPSKIKSYLFTTAHHLICSRARKKRPQLFSEMENPALALGEFADSEAVSAESSADLKLLQGKLDRILKTLSADHRTAFKLAVLQQKTYGEIARERGWSLAQVKTNVHRARKKVIGALGEELRPGLESAS